MGSDDEDSGITSRTKQAVMSGAIKFAPCPACDGTGTVPGEATMCSNCAAVLATSSSVHNHFGLSVCGICYEAMLGPRRQHRRWRVTDNALTPSEWRQEWAARCAEAALKPDADLVAVFDRVIAEVQIEARAHAWDAGYSAALDDDIGRASPLTRNPYDDTEGSDDD